MKSSRSFECKLIHALGIPNQCLDYEIVFGIMFKIAKPKKVIAPVDGQFLYKGRG